MKCRVIPDGADKTNLQVNTLAASVNYWDETFKEESFIKAIKAIAFRDIPKLIEKLELILLVPEPTSVTTPDTGRPASTGNVSYVGPLFVTREESDEISGDDAVMDTTGDQQGPQDTLSGHVSKVDKVNRTKLTPRNGRN